MKNGASEPKGERAKREPIKAIKLPIFADSYLTILAYHCLRGGGGSPATHANEAAQEKNKKTSGVWEVTELLHFIKGARAMQPFSVNP